MVVKMFRVCLACGVVAAALCMAASADPVPVNRSPAHVVAEASEPSVHSAHRAWLPVVAKAALMPAPGGTPTPTLTPLPTLTPSTTPTATPTETPTPVYVTLPQYLLLSQATTYEDFEDLNDWTAAGTGASMSANTSEWKSGTQSIRLTTGSGGAATMTRAVNWDLSRLSRLHLWIYLHGDPADLSGDIYIFFSNDTGFTNRFEASLRKSNAVQGWNFLAVPQERLLKEGTATWASPIIRLRVLVLPAPGKVVSVSCDKLEFGARAVPAILITFDDAYADQYDLAYPVLRSDGMRGSVFAPTASIGTASFMTLDQLRDLDSAGWSVCNHTRHHVSLAGLPEAAQEAELAGGRDDLIAWGLPRGAYYAGCPYSTYDADTLRAMASTGMLLGRNGDTTVYDAYCLSPHTLYQIPSNEVYASDSLAAVEGWVDRTIAEGSVLPLHFYSISRPGRWDSGTFTQFVDYVYSKRDQIAVLTMDDLYRCTLGPILVPRPAK